MLMQVSLCLFSAIAQSPDTLFYGDAPPVVYENPYGWGYIAGTNGYGDLGKYQRFDFYGEYDIAGAIVYMGAKKIVGDPDSIRIVFKRTTGVATNGPDSGPRREAIASISTTLDVFDTTGAGTTFMLPHPVTVSGNVFIADTLFIGIEWDVTANDTFAVFADTNGAGNLADRAWEMFYDSTLQRFNEQSEFSWLLDADIWIAALHYPAGTAGISDELRAEIPETYALHQNYPNPFNPMTTIGFSLPKTEFVNLAIFDLRGKEVAVLLNAQKSAGSYEVVFDASSYASGIYFYQITAGSFKQTRKLTVMK